MRPCRRCRRMLDEGSFPDPTRSTCRPCRAGQAREWRQANRGRVAEGKRRQRARALLRSNICGQVLAELLLASGQDWWAELARRVGEPEVVHEARAQWSELIAAAVRDAEDRHGAKPGDAVGVLHNMLWGSDRRTPEWVGGQK